MGVVEGGREGREGWLLGWWGKGREGRNGGSSLSKGCWEPLPASLGHLGREKTAKEICEMAKRSQV